MYMSTKKKKNPKQTTNLSKVIEELTCRAKDMFFLNTKYSYIFSLIFRSNYKCKYLKLCQIV